MLGAKGLAGAVRIEALTDRPERLVVGAEVYLEGEEAPRTIEALEPGGRVPVLRLSGIGRREEADALLGRYLEVDREEPPPGTYFWHEIIGLAAVAPDGAPIGKVVDVFRAGENEVYVIDRGDGGELLVPALRSVVRSIDPAAGTMVVAYEAEEVG